MRKINLIVIHCSASEWGDAKVIKEWHAKRGFLDIGYHYVILNKFQTYKEWKQNASNFSKDGIIEKGRSEEVMGAHVEGFNANSLGICLVGDRYFTPIQKQSLKILVRNLKSKYPGSEVKGHYELNPNKTCPNMDMNELRKFLES